MPSLGNEHLQRNNHFYAPQPEEADTNLSDLEEILEFDQDEFESRDPIYIHLLEAAAIAATVAVAYVFLFHADAAHFCLTGVFAKLGHGEAQHLLAQRYLQGKGVQRNTSLAMHWFKKAAEQGHVHAAYNLAVGHFKGYRSGVSHRVARDFLKKARDQGLPQAKAAWEKMLKHIK